MASTFLSIHPEYSKYAAWLTVALLLAIGANSLKQSIVALVIKLYEILVQKHAGL